MTTQLKIIWRIYIAEIRALPRGRFGLLAAGLVLLGPLLFATTVWTMPGGFKSAAIFNFIIIPSILMPIAASRLAHARGSRFLQAVFTTRVSQSTYYIAQLLVTLSLGLVYIATLLPFFFVHAAHVGWPPAGWTWLGIGLGMVTVSSAVGCLLGALFTSRGSNAATTTAVAFAVWTNAAWITIQFVGQLAPGLKRETLWRVFSTSPAVLLLASVGELSIYEAKNPHMPLLAFLGMTVAAMVAGWWVFAKAQAPEGWNASRFAHRTAAGLLALTLLIPAGVAGTDYDTSDHRFSGGWSSGGNNMTIELVQRGAPSTTQTGGVFGADPFAGGESVDADILVVLAFRAEPVESISEFTLRLSSDRIRFEPAEIRLINVTQFETMTFRGGSEHIQQAIRIPVRATFDAPQNLSFELYSFEASGVFAIPDSPDPIQAFSSNIVMASVPNITSKMLLAGIPLPLACIAGFGFRRWRMRA